MTAVFLPTGTKSLVCGQHGTIIPRPGATFQVLASVMYCVLLKVSLQKFKKKNQVVSKKGKAMQSPSFFAKISNKKSLCNSSGLQSDVPHRQQMQLVPQPLILALAVVLILHLQQLGRPELIKKNSSSAVQLSWFLVKPGWKKMSWLKRKTAQQEPKIAWGGSQLKPPTSYHFWARSSSIHPWWKNGSSSSSRPQRAGDFAPWTPSPKKHGTICHIDHPKKIKKKLWLQKKVSR